MRSKTIFGALLVSVALCSQGFGLELLDRMLGLNGGGCGECNACAKVAPCDPCAKACPEPCAKACPQACGMVSCEPACGKVCRPTPVRDLFADIACMFKAKGVQCDPVSACEANNACCPEPTCEKPAKCRKVRCKKACNPCDPAACNPCEPACEKVCAPKCHKLYRRPVLELLEAMFGCDDCDPCSIGCDTGCNTGCGGTAAPAAAPAKAPEKAAPLPAAPKADPSAAIPSRGIYSASRSLVRN